MQSPLQQRKEKVNLPVYSPSDGFSSINLANSSSGLEKKNQINTKLLKVATGAVNKTKNLVSRHEQQEEEFEKSKERYNSLKKELKEMIKSLQKLNIKHFQATIFPLDNFLLFYEGLNERFKPLQTFHNQINPSLTILLEKVNQIINELNEELTKLTNLTSKLKEDEDLWIKYDKSRAAFIKETTSMDRQKNLSSRQWTEQKMNSNKESYEDFHSSFSQELSNVVQEVSINCSAKLKQFLILQRDLFTEMKKNFQILYDSKDSLSKISLSSSTERISINQKIEIPPRPLECPLNTSFVSVDQVPLIISKTIQYLDERGNNVEGLFRESPDLLELKKLKAIFKQDNNIDLFLFNDPHLIAGLLKGYFRDLPESLIPSSIVDELMELRGSENFIPQASLTLKKMPLSDYHIFVFLLSFLHRFSLNESAHKMNALNLAICWAPTLFGRTLECNGLMGKLIQNYPSLFPQEKKEKENEKKKVEYKQGKEEKEVKIEKETEEVESQ